MDHHKIYTEMVHAVVEHMRTPRIVEYTAEVATAVETLGRKIADGVYSLDQLLVICKQGVADVPGIDRIRIAHDWETQIISIRVDIPSRQDWTGVERGEMIKLLCAAIPKSTRHRVFHENHQTCYAFSFK